jgi:lysophospholipase L1-like esterase
VVVIGDSLSAGYQNGSMLDSQQPNGWASLFAQQASFPLQLPLISFPGAPAVLQLLSTGNPPVIEAAPGITTGRDNVLVQPYDLAVPGHTLHQLIYDGPTTSPADSEDIITDLVLGAPLGNSLSQLGETIVLHPSTVFLWIGGNDGLAGLEAGTPSAMTPLSDFSADYATLIAGLSTATHAHLVVANLPDPTMIPYLTHGSVILNQAAQATGLSTATVSAQLGVMPGDLLNSGGLDDFDNELAGLASGGTLTPLPGSDVLTTAEIATIQSTIDSYNQAIAGLVAGVGGTLVDLHAYYKSLSNGVSINGYTATTAFLGGIFSLDGVHPTNTGYALLANQFIMATNTAFGLSVPLVDVSKVAASDPYFGPNIKAAPGIQATPGLLAHIPAAAARQADLFMKPKGAR